MNGGAPVRMRLSEVAVRRREDRWKFRLPRRRAADSVAEYDVLRCTSGGPKVVEPMDALTGLVPTDGNKPAAAVHAAPTGRCWSVEKGTDGPIARDRPSVAGSKAPATLSCQGFVTPSANGTAVIRTLLQKVTMRSLRPISVLPPLASALAGFIVLALVMLVGAAGCADRRLETGYGYRPLNSSPIERRAFYADPYSIEARQAEAEQSGGFSPGSGLEGRSIR